MEEQEEELNGIYAEVLHQYEANAIDGIIEGGFGAMDTEHAKDGYYLIKWTGEPYLLTEPSDEVEGCEGDMPAGTYVCEGQYLTRLPRAPHWYHFDSKAPMCVFRLQFIIAPNIVMMAYHAQENKPQSLNGLSAAAKRAVATTVMKVPEEMQELIAEEKMLRDKLDYADYQLNNDLALAAAAAAAPPEDEDTSEEDEEDEEEEGIDYDRVF